MQGHRTITVMEAGTLRRPSIGHVWHSKELGLPLNGLPGWQSNGGPDRNHPDRRKPYLLEISAPRSDGILTRLHFVGVFGLHGNNEAAGTVGASILVGEDRFPDLKLDLVNGRHYTDATDLGSVHRLTGDGASIETVGRCQVDGVPCRVGLLTVDLPTDTPLSRVRFRDLGTPASFILFDLVFEYAPITSCPFRTRSGGVALSELAAVVRMGDRVTLRRALDQLEDAVMKTPDLDEAKGEALTFIAVVTAAMLEMGGSRAMHRVQLEAARKLDSFSDRDEIVNETRCIIEHIAMSWSEENASPSGMLVDRALSILNRNFAKNLSDSSIASQLNLSTSHFRFLFREVTGQPFHKYLIGLRLERARKLLLEGMMPVSEVATAVGFHGLAHFSRAFTQRFSISPTNLRRSAIGVAE